MFGKRRRLWFGNCRALQPLPPKPPTPSPSGRPGQPFLWQGCHHPWSDRGLGLFRSSKVPPELVVPTPSTRVPKGPSLLETPTNLSHSATPEATAVWPGLLPPAPPPPGGAGGTSPAEGLALLPAQGNMGGGLRPTP